MIFDSSPKAQAAKTQGQSAAAKAMRFLAFSDDDRPEADCNSGMAATDGSSADAPSVSSETTSSAMTKSSPKARSSAKPKRSQQPKYNPIATHGFCFLLGITVMAYSWPDREQMRAPISHKKNHIYLWLSPKHMTLPEPILPVPYLLARRLSGGDICLISAATLTLTPGSKPSRIQVSFRHTAATEPLVTALRQTKPLVVLPADHPLAVDPCGASRLRIEYGS